MKTILFAILCCLYFFPTFSQTTYNGNLSNTDLKFNRTEKGNPPSLLSTTGTNVYYNIIRLAIINPQLITFSTSSPWDNFLILYNSSGLTPASALNNVLMANDDNNNTNAGFTYNFTVAGTYYLVICSYDNNVTGAYSITSSAPIVLPIKLTAFTAEKDSPKSNLLKWSSTEEIDLAMFEMQRSTNGNSFIDLPNNDIVPQNNLNSNNYVFTDNNPAAGINYYRLKITEKSGQISYSPIALVKNGNATVNTLKLFPNPAAEYVQMDIKSANAETAFISIINGGGQVVQSGQYPINEKAILSINIKKLPAGKYFLKMLVAEEESMATFIKK